MKQNMDLARQILTKLEDDPEATGEPLPKVSIDGRSADEVSYHVMMLAEAGLLVALDGSDGDQFLWEPTRLTWQGHQFLTAARSDTLWEKAKKLTLEKTGGLAFEFLKTALMKVGTDALTGG